MPDDSRIPRVIVDASVMRTLPLSAADGFVLSRIDGQASERDLANQTGLPPMQIQSSLDKLLNLKAITFAKVPAPVASKPSLGGDRASTPGLPPAGRSGAESGSGPAATPVSALLEDAIANIPEDAPELKEEVELPVELRRRVLGLHSVINSLDHYATLGLGRDVDKKGVKRAYFELAAVFHPDKYFRKNIGSFKGKMEVIFGKVSVAYETLVDKERRAEYDEYLGDVEKSRAVEAMLRNVMNEVENAERAVAEIAGSSPSLPPAAGSSPVSPPPAAPPKSSAVADQLRREALAMRLRGNRPVTKPPLIVPAAPIVPPAPRSNPAEAVDALKRRYEDRVEAARRAQGEKYVKLGETAESRNDLTAAAAAYRVALPFLRQEDPSHAHALEVIAKSEAALGETYARQAEHEERQRRWEDAARSWGRAVKFRPNDHRAHERYSNALVESKGDLHLAVQMAQRAIQIAPTVGDYRCTLANAYIAANLMLNARRELESAAAQFPENPNIPVVMKKLPPK